MQNAKCKIKDNFVFCVIAYCIVLNLHFAK